MTAFRRILLKLSGEALAGKRGYGFDVAVIESICRQIGDVRNAGVQVAIVVGGGNIFRGLKASTGGMDRGTADTMGMLATVINGLALGDVFERLNIPARHLSALPVAGVVDQFDHRKASACLDSGAISIFSGGTGNPYFSTDTAASLRAAQIGADVIIKGTKVDGIYPGDPVEDSSLVKYDSITFNDVLNRGLKVMDATAIAMCRDNGIPIIVFNLTREGDLLRVVRGERIGTIVKEESHG
jgi:uridylate kinase